MAPNPKAKLPARVEVDETGCPSGSKSTRWPWSRGRRERLNLRPGSPGFDWGDWFERLEKRGVRGMTTDGPAQLDRARERPPEVGTVLRHLVECWNDRVRSELEAAVPTLTIASRAGSAASNPGPAWDGALARRRAPSFVRLMARGMA